MAEGKEYTCNTRDLGSIPGLGRSSGRGHGKPLQYSCLENPQGQRSLVGYSPWDHQESDVTEWLSTIHSSNNYWTTCKITDSWNMPVNKINKNPCHHQFTQFTQFNVKRILSVQATNPWIQINISWTYRQMWYLNPWWVWFSVIESP